MHSDDKLFAMVGGAVLVVVAAFVVVASSGLSFRAPTAAADKWSVTSSVPQAVPELAAGDEVPFEPAASAATAVDDDPAAVAPAALPAAFPCDIDTILAVVDAIAAGEVPAAWLDAVDGRREVLVRRTSDDRLVLAAGTFRRYRGLVDGLAGFEPAAIVAALDVAAGPAGAGVRWASLERPSPTRLVAAIDHLLATPVVAEPAEMVSRGGRWTFADEALEELTPAQQQLVLMGPDHAAAARAILESLRDELRGADPAFPDVLAGPASNLVVAAASSKPAIVATAEAVAATTSP